MEDVKVGKIRWTKPSENSSAVSEVDLQLRTQSEVESISDEKPHLSISASQFNTFSNYFGPFHSVKLILSTDGDNEIYINIVM